MCDGIDRYTGVTIVITLLCLIILHNWEITPFIKVSGDGNNVLSSFFSVFSSLLSFFLCNTRLVFRNETRWGDRMRERRIYQVKKLH